VDGITPSARLHRVLSKDVGYQVGALRLPSGDFTSSDGEAAQHLLMIHFPGCQPISSNSPQFWAGFTRSLYLTEKSAATRNNLQK
jgi:hypothetical protein